MTQMKMVHSYWYPKIRNAGSGSKTKPTNERNIGDKFGLEHLEHHRRGTKLTTMLRQSYQGIMETLRRIKQQLLI